MGKLKSINRRIEFYDVWKDFRCVRTWIDWYEVQGMCRSEAYNSSGDLVKNGTRLLMHGGHELVVGVDINVMVERFRNSRIQKYINIVGKKWN